LLDHSCIFTKKIRDTIISFVLGAVGFGQSMYLVFLSN
jgi:hypothetical protein